MTVDVDFEGTTSSSLSDSYHLGSYNSYYADAGGAGGATSARITDFRRKHKRDSKLEQTNCPAFRVACLVSHNDPYTKYCPFLSIIEILLDERACVQHARVRSPVHLPCLRNVVDVCCRFFVCCLHIFF